MRPDLYVHRLIERLGLRRQQLFAAQADVVERLRALARFGELAAAYVAARRRRPRASSRARSPRSPTTGSATRGAGAHRRHGVQVLPLTWPAGSRPSTSTSSACALRWRLDALDPSRSRTRCCTSRCRLTTRPSRARVASAPYVAVSRPRAGGARLRRDGDRGSASHRCARSTLRGTRSAASGELKEELFGPAETLHSTYRLLRDELIEGTLRAAGRLGELRLDTDLDVSHAVVRYLELLKLAALIDAAPVRPGVADALRDINVRIRQAVTAEQREIFTTSPLDEYLLDAERDVRRRTRVIAARDEPSLERFLPMRGDGVLLSATDIDTYRACPLRYKFARVFRIPQEPTLHQRFGIAVHQVLERYHAEDEAAGRSDRVTDAARRQLAPRRLR